MKNLTLNIVAVVAVARPVGVRPAGRGTYVSRLKSNVMTMM